jgi:hypothetical protein
MLLILDLNEHGERSVSEQARRLLRRKAQLDQGALRTAAPTSDPHRLQRLVESTERATRNPVYMLPAPPSQREAQRQPRPATPQ